MPAHAPGPYREGNTGPDQIMLLDANDDYVCSIQIAQCGGGAIASAMEPRRRASAQLLKSAPDLLEALQDCVEFHGDAEDPDDDWAHIRRARAAIAKALGQ